MLRRCLVLFSCVLAPCLQAQTQTKPFLIGADWQDGASPAVKELFWETGCNFARLTGGGYGWVVDSHRRALAELEKHGARVLLQLGSHYPDAKFFDLKDAYFVDQNGKTGVPSRQSWAVEYDGQAWPQYSYASGKFREELTKDFAAYFKALGPLHNVEALLLHNEPGYFWLDNRIFDYNQDSIARFRDWLPSQHSSIGELNRSWGTAFDSFATVDPPRLLPPAKNSAAWMDWRRSNVGVIEDFLGWERGFARQVEPGLPTTTNLPGPIDNWYPIRLSDNYHYSEGQDIASIDIYPGAEWTSRFFPGFTMDMTRGAADGKRVFVAECESYASAHFPKLSDSQRADRLTSDLWSYIGHGANGILVWSLNGQDGFRLTDGEFNARLGALRETAHVAKMLNLGEFTKPTRKVALVIDEDSYFLSNGQDKPRDWAGKLSGAALRLYGALATAHVEVDVLSADQVRKGVGSRYKALVLASVETMDSSLAQRLSTYVETGGLLISDASLARYDRWGKECSTRPGFGLDKLFGVQAGSSGAEAVRRHGAKGITILLGTNDSFAQSIADWLQKFAGVRPELTITNSKDYLDVMLLKGAKANTLAVVTNPPDKAEPAKESFNLQAHLTKMGIKSQSFLFASPIYSRDHVLSGPQPLLNGSWIIPHLVSHAAILTARDHTVLLATESPQAVQTGSKVSVWVTVYNPSPRALSGSLKLNLPAGWVGKPVSLKVPLFGHVTLALAATAGQPTARTALKAVFTGSGSRVESIPFDIEVRERQK